MEKVIRLNGKDYKAYFIGTEVEEDTNAVNENWFVPNWTKGYDLTDEQDDYLWENVDGYVHMAYGTVYSETVSSDYEADEFTEEDWME